MRPPLTALAALAGVLMIGCSEQPGLTDPAGDPALSPVSGATAAAAKVTFHFPLEGPFGIGFTSPCTGGSVEGTGEIAGQVNVVGEEVFEGVILGLHIEEHGTVTGTVTDDATGATYRFHNSYHNGFNTPSGPAPNFTSTSTSTLVARPTTGGGAAMLIHLVIHTTVNANGVESSTVEVDNSKCLR